MQNRNRVIWSYSLEFLSLFHGVQYDGISIALPLLRDFQKYVRRHDRSARQCLKFINTIRDQNLQRACQPYMPSSRPDCSKPGKILARATLYPLTSSIDDQDWIYVAHRKKEYQHMRHIEKTRPLLYLPELSEAKIDPTEADTVYRQVNEILSTEDTPTFFQSRSFRIWLRKKITHLLKKIRKVHTMFEQHTIQKVICDSTINRYGALLTTFAQSKNIQTIGIQHGVLGEVGHLPVNADVQLVWGASHQQYLESYGVPTHKCKIIPPCFPKSEQHKSVAQHSPKKANGLFSQMQQIFAENQVTNTNCFRQIHPQVQQNNDSHRARAVHVLVALQPLGKKFNRKMIQRIEKAVQICPIKPHVIYKCHPDQKIRTSYTKQIKSNTSQLIKDHRSCTLHDFIIAADIVITPFSTVAYEALLAEKPVIFYGKPRNTYYLQTKPNVVKQSSVIGHIFLKATQDKDYLHFLRSRHRLKDQIVTTSNLATLLKKALNIPNPVKK